MLNLLLLLLFFKRGFIDNVFFFHVFFSKFVLKVGAFGATWPQMTKRVF
jgi:hypothetical protein